MVLLAAFALRDKGEHSRSHKRGEEDLRQYEAVGVHLDPIVVLKGNGGGLVRERVEAEEREDDDGGGSDGQPAGVRTDVSRLHAANDGAEAASGASRGGAGSDYGSVDDAA